MHPGVDRPLPTSDPASPSTSCWSLPPAWAAQPETTEDPPREVCRPRGSSLPTTHHPPPAPSLGANTQPDTPRLNTSPARQAPAPACPPPRRETAPWPRASPFTSGLKLGQQGGPPPLRLDDGARRQVRGVVPGVVLVLQQADVLQPEDRVSGCPLHSRRRGEGSPAQGPPTSSPGPEASGKRHVQR